MEHILFEIKNYQGKVIKVVKGTTKQDINKPRVVDVNVEGGKYIVSEEQDRISEVKHKYNEVWKKDIKQQREQLLETIKKETNWKLRVLNEQAKEAKNKAKEAKNREDIMEAAEALIMLSKQEPKKKSKKVVTNESLKKPRRSSRIAGRKNKN